MKSEFISMVRLNTPLIKGNHYNGNRMSFNVGSFEDNQKSLEDILRELAVSKVVNHVRSSLDITTRFKEEPNVEQENSDLFEYDFNGSFSVPWRVDIKSSVDDIIAVYEVSFTRPDSSLKYVLFSQKNINLRVKKGEEYAKRTNIDGLPCSLRVEEWILGETDGGELVAPSEMIPRRLSLIGIGLKSVSVPLGFKGYDIQGLGSTSTFDGNWRERLYLCSSSGKIDLNLGIEFKGNWKR